jgi:hypothetical protein
VDGLTPDAVDAARAEGGTLLEAWSIRASPHLVPSGDLDGRVLTKRELGAACQPHLPQALRPWFEPSRFSEFTAVLARAAALTGLFCMVPRSGGQASFARTDQWLGHQPPPTDPDQARAELLRRYLRCYGPSTAADYAAWAGIAGPEAERTWALLEGELGAVSFEGADRRLLAADLPALLEAPAPSGVRLLPPYDPWLQQRERALLVADAGRRRLLWRASGNPGVVVADGEIVATWRPARQGRRRRRRVHLIVHLIHQDHAVELPPRRI